MRESKIESRYKKVTSGKFYKFISPGVRGVPDRIVLNYIPEDMRKIVSRYIFFIEFKAPGKKPNTRQAREIQSIRDLGFLVEVIDG